MGKIVCILPTK